RRVHLRGGRRPRDRRGEASPFHLGRRLRRADQPPHRRGPDPWGTRRGKRHRAHAADRVRRPGQLPERVVHGLSRAELERGARLGARRDGHPLTAPPARREGRGGVRERRLTTRGGERGGRPPRALWRDPRRHAGYARARVGGNAAGRDGATAMSRAAELSAAGVAFVEATVVRCVSPTCARPGDRAIVLGDGTIEGFVGGSCADTSVRLQALRVLETGEPTRLRILPGEEDGPSDEDGTVVVSNPCLSGGALELFLEPRLPAPRVAVAGEPPRARGVGVL